MAINREYAAHVLPAGAGLETALTTLLNSLHSEGWSFTVEGNPTGGALVVAERYIQPK